MNVLVVDDSEVARAAMEEALTNFGFRVIGLPSPIGVTQTVSREQINVVVIDVNMPGIRGDRIAALFRRQNQSDKVGVVLVSGMDRQELEQLGRDCGADAVVTKQEVAQVLPYAVMRAFSARRKP